ncbi:MAG TPA: PLP-dependent aminotransferase family protein [Roseiarcus sp.]|jgi:DNA-binding transcriptional MocR family regulator|nr:PLP-dependent aminotransferase family protein [Roseiarcus sp.]
MLHAPPSDGRKLTRAAAVVEAVRARIDGRALAPGARLPSVRAMAAAMAVSKSTVVEAYDRLLAEGAIVARRGSGFYVAGPTRPLSLAAIGPQLDRAIDPLWVMRQSLQAGPDMLTPGSGWLPESWMPDLAIQRGLRHVAREAVETRTQYDAPLGFAPLRQQMALRFGERGVSAAPDQIILTNSASHALDLVCRFLLEPGDAVLVDDPCYFNFHALLRAHRARIVGVPHTPDGPDVEAFARILAEEKPRFYLAIAGLHNPTGATLAPAVAHRLLKLAEKHATLIVEDEVFADLEPAPATRMASFDGFERVIQVGSLTKTVSAAFRCGFIAAKHEWIEALIDLKLATSGSSGRLSAVLLHRILTEGGYRRHLDQLRAKLSSAMGLALRRLEAAGLTAWLEPRGGMFLWARLPDGLDAADVARIGLRRGVVFAPGNVFSLAQGPNPYLRFNVALCSPPRVFATLAEAMNEAARGAAAA